MILFKLKSSVSKVELIEHTMVPVLGQRTPVLLTILTPLGKESAQVSTLSQLIAIQGFVNLITTNLVIALAHRHHVDTLSWLQTDLPVVLRHTRYYVVVRQMPFLTHVAVLYPNIAILLRKTNLRHSILHKDRGMGLAIQMHNLALIVHQILKPQRRGDHLLRRTEMIELTTIQGHNSHTQIGYFTIGLGRISAQGTAKLAIEVVFF